VNGERQRYLRLLNELTGLKGDLHFEGSEGGGYPIVEFRLRPDVGAERQHLCSPAFKRISSSSNGLRDMRVKSVAVPLPSLIE